MVLGTTAEEMGKINWLILSVLVFQAFTTLCKTARPVFGERNLNSCSPPPSSTKLDASKTKVRNSPHFDTCDTGVIKGGVMLLNNIITAG